MVLETITMIMHMWDIKKKLIYFTTCQIEQKSTKQNSQYAGNNFIFSVVDVENMVNVVIQSATCELIFWVHVIFFSY